MLEASLDKLPVEIVEEIIQYLAIPPKRPYCVQSTYGGMRYGVRHKSVHIETFKFRASPFPTGFVALSRVSKRYRRICQPFLHRERTMWMLPKEYFPGENKSRKCIRWENSIYHSQLIN